MNKQLLIRFIKRTATISEQECVLRWIDESRANESYFVQLKNLLTVTNLPETKASEKEYRDFCSRFPLGQKQNNIRTIGLVALAAATVAVLLTVVIGCLLAPSEHKAMFVECSTNKGVKGTVDLPDGSKVWLNSDSYIKFPDHFKGKYRQVEFSGEAYFSVAKNPDCPMLISTPNKVQVEVRGTNFNLSCYPNDDEIKATLYSGEIIVYSEDAKTGARKATNLKPFETVCIAKTSASVAEASQPAAAPIRIEKDGDAMKYTAWKRGELIFEASPLDEVIRKLERWHGVEFVVKSDNIYSNTLTACFKSESIQQIMEMLKICCPIDFTLDKNTVVISER
ncbi:MAG: FecR family protein [Prevotellaceae bacterium]|jgi:ferric-dicitrate binding protein FerR (iron transport regulator)|nr:FecR family protein [Prevotellaceae bacterium]